MKKINVNGALTVCQDSTKYFTCIILFNSQQPYVYYYSPLIEKDTGHKDVKRLFRVITHTNVRAILTLCSDHSTHSVFSVFQIWPC